MGLFYRRINPIFFPRQRGNGVSTIGNLQLAISFATGETFEWNFYFERTSVCLLQTLIEQTRVWPCCSFLEHEERQKESFSRDIPIYLYVASPFFPPLFTTAFNVVCRWLYQKMTRTFRLQLYPFISQACAILHVCKILPSKELFSIYPGIFYTQEVIREGNCFSKCLPRCPRPRGGTKAFRNIGRDILSRSLVLKRKFFSRRVIQMAWRSLEVVGISCKALVNYCAAEYFTGNARNWRARIFFLEKGGDANVPIWIIVYQASKLSRQFSSIQRLVIFTCFNNSQVIGWWKFHWWDFFFFSSFLISTMSNNSFDLCVYIIVRFINLPFFIFLWIRLEVFKDNVLNEEIPL